jgi:hypothetical protein
LGSTLLGVACATGFATCSGSDNLNTGKSEDDTLMPQAAVMRTIAAQRKSVVPVAMEANATRAVPERVMTRPPKFLRQVCAYAA